MGEGVIIEELDDFTDNKDVRHLKLHYKHSRDSSIHFIQGAAVSASQEKNSVSAADEKQEWELVGDEEEKGCEFNFDDDRSDILDQIRQCL